MWPELYSKPERLENFMEAMCGISAGAFMVFAKSFDFSKYKILVDVGGATGQLSAYVARENKHMRCISTDLPEVKPIADRWIERWGVQDRVQAVTNDFIKNDIPKADVITMGMILHDWGLPEKKMLIKKAYDALPKGGALVSLEAVIDDERRIHTHGLCMSLNMLIEFGYDGGFDFTHQDFDGWCREAGFERTEKRHLVGPTSAVIAYK
jgi:cyclopropane fatty-acyl-phospholipid synthase-like methyltransferase